MCDIELILRNPASEVENVWGAQIMWNWIGMHARLYWLSQIHFHFLKFTFNYLEITFTFFKSTFACKKFIFSNWPHFLRRRGADSSGNPTYVQFMPFEHLAWAQNFHQLITWSAVSTKNACSNRFNEMCAFSRSGKQHPVPFVNQLGVKPLVSVNENFKLGPFPAFVDGAKTLSM